MVAIRKSLPLAMSLPLARQIIGGDLGSTSKMPGHSWGIAASACARGSVLAMQPDTVCSRCYAMRGHYACPSVVNAHERRAAGLADPRWVQAMAYLLRAYDERHFRWFDSGDLQSVDHLAKICQVASRTAHTRHWLPTHEPFIVGQYLAGGGIVPPNLVIRISADHIEDRPTTDTYGMCTATVHKHRGEPVPAPGGNRKHSIECRAHVREHRCGPCRACWDPRVKNVSYPLT